MDPELQDVPAQANAAELRAVWNLLVEDVQGERISGTLHIKSLLARAAFRRVREEGATCEEIAEATGFTAERVRWIERRLVSV